MAPGYVIWLGFNPEAAKLFIREQGLDSPKRVRVLLDKNVVDICNVMRKPGSKNADGMPIRRQQVSVIAQENLKLAVFLFHHRWRCNLDWEVTGMHEDTVHLLAGQKRLEGEYKDMDMLPKINKSDMARMMEATEEYLRSCQGVMRAPLAYIIRKTILVQTYDEYPKYATPDDEMIARMLHLPPDKNKLLQEQDSQTAKACTAEYKIDNRSVNYILDQNCKDTDLYPHNKQHKSKRNSRGTFYAIHSRWLGLNHVNLTAL